MKDKRGRIPYGEGKKQTFQFEKQKYQDTAHCVHGVFCGPAVVSGTYVSEHLFTEGYNRKHDQLRFNTSVSDQGKRRSDD